MNTPGTLTERPLWRAEPSSSIAPVVVGASGLRIADVVRVATDAAEVVLDPDAQRRISAARGVIERVLEHGKSVYGLTTHR
jgi:histidine ammonia-lyase